MLKAGSSRIDLDHGQDRGERHLEGQQVAELLLDHVADHALGLGAQHVERIGLVGLVGGALQRQQPDLRAVAVGDHELVLPGDRRERLGRDADIRALDLGGHRLAALQQGVAAERDDDAHGSVPQRGDEDGLDVCIRFSACSKATFSLGLEHVVGHLHAVGDAELLADICLPTSVSVSWKAGRQCMNFDLRVAARLHQRRG